MIAFTGALAGSPPTPTPALAKSGLAESYGRLPLAFEVNAGQTDERVKFLAHANGYALLLTNNEAILALSRPRTIPGSSGREGVRPINRPEPKASATPTAPVEAAVLRMKLLGANSQPRVKGDGKLPGKVHYYLGKDPAKWRTGIATYGAVRYEEVYPGIDLAYYGNQHRLEYDFVVAPGADPAQIRLAFQGAEPAWIDPGGDLVLKTAAGEVRQRRPHIYQEIDGRKAPIAGGYVALPNAERDRAPAMHQFGFKLAAYDRRRPLVIDPTLEYSTFLGGERVGTAPGNENGAAIAVDNLGSAYVTGKTASINFPRVNPFDNLLNSGPATFVFTDAFVTKLSPDGSSLVYSTYLGGASHDVAKDIALDDLHHAHITGETFSTDFPLRNAVQTDRPGYDGFVTKLSPDGAMLVYSTYLGGDQRDVGFGIAVDDQRSAYVTGDTASTDFPRLNQIQSDQPGLDAFVTKLDFNGSLAYSTYLGGNGDDRGFSIAVDRTQQAHITGDTSSSNFPLANAFQTDQPGPDAIAVKLNAAGNALLYATYLGGNAVDQGLGIAIDDQQSVYLTGATSSTNFFLLAPFQGDQPGFDAFVTKLNVNGAPAYSTYLGGDLDDAGGDIAVDAQRNAYVVGETFSTNFPLLLPLQPDRRSADAFITQLNPAGNTLGYSTYLGGRDLEYAAGVAIDLAGDAYVTGETNSIDFPTTPGAFDRTLGLISDGFVAKICPLTIVVTPDPIILCAGDKLTVTATGAPAGGAFTWTTSDTGAVTISGTGSSVELTGVGRRTTAIVRATYTLAGRSCTRSVDVKVTTLLSAQVKRLDEPDVVFSSNPGPFCVGDPIAGRVLETTAQPLGDLVKWELRQVGLLSDTIRAAGVGVRFGSQTISVDQAGRWKVIFYCDANQNNRFDEGLFSAEHNVQVTFDVEDVQEVQLTVSRHRNVSFGSALVDARLASGSLLLRRKDRNLTEGGDVRCCVRFTRQGNVRVFGVGGDGLDIITSNQELEAVFAAAGDIKLVISMTNVCNATGAVLGCARSGGTQILVTGAAPDVWIHERGHVEGLHHSDEAGGGNRTSPFYIMHATAPATDSVTESECEAFKP